MKKEVIIVPKDKCPLDVLAEMGNRTKNAWVYFHENTVKKLEETCNKSHKFTGFISLIWYDTEKFPMTNIHICTEKIGCWQYVQYISADDIAFNCMVEDPEEIFFLKMEE